VVSIGKRREGIRTAKYSGNADPDREGEQATIPPKKLPKKPQARTVTKARKPMREKGSSAKNKPVHEANGDHHKV